MAPNQPSQLSGESKMRNGNGSIVKLKTSKSLNFVDNVDFLHRSSSSGKGSGNSQSRNDAVAVTNPSSTIDSLLLPGQPSVVLNNNNLFRSPRSSNQDNGVNDLDQVRVENDRKYTVTLFNNSNSVNDDDDDEIGKEEVRPVVDASAAFAQIPERVVQDNDDDNDDDKDDFYEKDSEDDEEDDREGMAKKVMSQFKSQSADFQLNSEGQDSPKKGNLIRM
jgi:hypothetical protein